MIEFTNEGPAGPGYSALYVSNDVYEGKPVLVIAAKQIDTESMVGVILSPDAARYLAEQIIQKFGPTPEPAPLPYTGML